MIIPAELGYPAKGDPDHNIVGPKYVLHCISLNFTLLYLNVNVEHNDITELPCALILNHRYREF